MYKKKEAIDSINVLLEECVMAYPVSSFVISLYKQYQERGSLSKKQLQGLYAKASKIKDLPPGKLAAVEVIIKRMPTRDKSEQTITKPVEEKVDSTGETIEAILTKYPQHKRVLFLKSKYDNNEAITAAEIADLERFKKLLVK
jgi:hypothetical protein